MAVLIAPSSILASCSPRGSDVPLEGAIAAQAAICRPELTVDDTLYEAGTAFIVNGPRRLLVTAHHLFGEMGGLTEEIRWQDMPTRATSARCRPFREKGEWTTGAALAIAGAHPVFCNVHRRI